MKNKISNLYITGDSFSQMPPNDINEKVWTVQLARLIDSNLTNGSCVGVSQDWNWSIIDRWIDEITPDDQLIILLTDPGRFWFIENRPDLSNSWIVESEFVREIGNLELKKAIEYYIQYIQRPALDFRFLSYRLGWLNNIVSIKKWRKPLVILAFNQHIPSPQHYPELTIVSGDLMRISHAEEDQADPIDYRHVDVRYNHLTLSNHTILATKISNFLTNNTPLDLTTGFNTGIYSLTSINNPEFANYELSLVSLEKYNEMKSILPGQQQSIMSRFLHQKKPIK